MQERNKKSFDAKTYINKMVNQMRERYNRCEEDLRRYLVEILRKQTSSDEYQKNLKIVRKDANLVRKYAKHKKGGDITAEEFKEEIREFYGKDMDLAFGEDFEKLRGDEKVKYIIGVFGDTDRAADLVVKLLDSERTGTEDRNDKERRVRRYLGLDRTLSEDCLFSALKDRYGRGPVTIRLLSYMKNDFEGFDSSDLEDYDLTDIKITQSTLKYFIGKGAGAENMMCSLSFDCCEDGSITDYDVLNTLIKNRNYNRDSDIPFKKICVEGQKFVIDSCIKKGKFGRLLIRFRGVINEDINLGEGVDVVDYIFNSEIDFSIKEGKKEEDLFSDLVAHNRAYHEKIVDILISKGKKESVRKWIDKFTGLSDEKRAEIMRDDEVLLNKHEKISKKPKSRDSGKVKKGKKEEN